MQIIKFDNVSLAPKDSQGFHGLDWTVETGECWAVVGPNNSGKSMLTAAVKGRIRPLGGRLFCPDRKCIEQISINAVSSLIRGQGVFYQSRWNSIMDDETMGVEAYLSAKSVPAADVLTDIAPVARMLEIDPLLSKRMNQLSNGELKKVVLAGVLVNAPELIIYESPFAGLDQVYRPKMDHILSWVTRQTPCIIVETHPDALPSCITHRIELDRFQVKYCGPHDPVQHVPGRPITAAVRAASPTTPVPGTPPTVITGKSNPGKIDTGPAPSQTESPVLVDMKQVRVTYGRQVILEDICWTIREKEHWALTGPNGSGKTTLLGLIAGDHPQAYANDITLFGIPRGSGESIWDIKARIGLVSPELHLYFPKDIPLFEVVCSGFFDSLGCFKTCSAPQLATASNLISSMGLIPEKDRLFGALSPGIQRLGLIARALVKEPLLLLLDEPCQNLDPENTRMVLEMITRQVNRSSATLVYVTHVPQEIPDIVSKHLALDKGPPLIS